MQGRHYQWACHCSRQRRWCRDYGYCLSLAWKSYSSFPNCHVHMIASINSRPLRRFLVYSIFFMPIQSCLSFRESYSHENSAFGNSGKFSPTKDSCYMVHVCLTPVAITPNSHTFPPPPTTFSPDQVPPHGLHFHLLQVHFQPQCTSLFGTICCLHWRKMCLFT